MLAVAAGGLLLGVAGMAWAAEDTVTPAAVFAEAAASAVEIHDLHARACTLAAVAAAEAEAGLKQQARQTFAKAFTAAKQHDKAEPPENTERENALSEIVDAQIEAGFLSDAAATARMLENPAAKTFIFLERILHVRENGTLGDREVADIRNHPALCDEALAYVRALPPERNAHTVALAKIAVVQAKAGRKEQARHTFAEAIAAVKPPDVNGEYCLIACFETKAGFPDDALALVRRVKPGWEVKILANVAHEQVRVGQIDRARANLRQAVALAARERGACGYAILIATAEVEAKMTSEAVRTFHEAAIAAVQSGRVESVRDLAAAQIQAGMPAEAAGTFQAAIVAAGQWSAAARGRVLADLAATQADLGMRKRPPLPSPRLRPRFLSNAETRREPPSTWLPGSTPQSSTPMPWTRSGRSTIRPWPRRPV